MLHIIGGAITPLWQSLETTDATRLRVVRVTSDDGHRIVGVQISGDQVGEVLRSLGVTRSLREPVEIYNGVLVDGEEVRLTAGLLKPGSIHGDPAIELCGTDPSMFGVLRKLGLLNEQINWKQRFFVPTDEEQGIKIIGAVLKQFPIIATDDYELAEILPNPRIPSAITTQPIDLETWIIEPPDICTNNDTQRPEQALLTRAEADRSDDNGNDRFRDCGPGLYLSVAGQITAAAVLQTPPPDYRTPTLQIGFDFDESEY
jgi:hypothetical protein